jgi:ATP-dependent DNA helicase RecG
MRENGSPPPEFYNPETRSFMTVILPIHEAFKIDTEEKVSPHPVKTTEKSVEKTREKIREKTREKILKYLAENPAATQNDIVAVIGISVKGVEWNLKALKENGRLRRVGPDKGGHWEVIEQV